MRCSCEPMFLSVRIFFGDGLSNNFQLHYVIVPEWLSQSSCSGALWVFLFSYWCSISIFWCSPKSQVQNDMKSLSFPSWWRRSTASHPLSYGWRLQKNRWDVWSIGICSVSLVPRTINFFSLVANTRTSYSHGCSRD